MPTNLSSQPQEAGRNSPYQLEGGQDLINQLLDFYRSTQNNPFSAPISQQAASGAMGSVQENMPRIQEFLQGQLHTGVAPEVSQFMDNRAKLGKQENEGMMRDFLARSPGGSVGMSAISDAMLGNNRRNTDAGTQMWLNERNQQANRGMQAAGGLAALPGMYQVPSSIELQMLGMGQNQQNMGLQALLGAMGGFGGTWGQDEVAYGPSPQQEWWNNNSPWINALLGIGGQGADAIGKLLPFLLF